MYENLSINEDKCKKSIQRGMFAHILQTESTFDEALSGTSYSIVECLKYAIASLLGTCVQIECAFCEYRAINIGLMHEHTYDHVPYTQLGGNVGKTMMVIKS